MKLRSPAYLFALSAVTILALAGCVAPGDPAAAAPTASGASASASSDDATADATSTYVAEGGEPGEATDAPVATPANLPAGAEVDPVTGVWVYSDEVAFLDLPQDADEFLSEPLASLPTLPEIPSLAGQQLADDAGLVDVWDLQQYYIADCMADAGFEWRWVYYDGGFEGSFSDESPDATISHPADYTIPGTWSDQTPGFQAALWGENDFMSPDYDPNYVYHWTTAGCDGYAVHVTGMDDAH
ncbi:hypothetical protein [Gulosibacter sp. ACHW.36C]|uniref:Secreted protein n=1 Tax=Gulosibacter sediminis TaxID=1729695 RepID=A0ABY4MYK0_9MICO|nr:hypothetical protein [Gulosibacter sediminis]UQN14272.1 hypothetical protein M3M28_09445 [Gulosibacter sediminis]